MILVTSGEESMKKNIGLECATPTSLNEIQEKCINNKEVTKFSTR